MPAALAQAPRLRRLGLFDNRHHQLDGADVAVLRTLRRLACIDLRLRWEAHPAQALAELRAALPACEVMT